MVIVRQTLIFSKWLDRLRDDRAVLRIQARIDRLVIGNFGDMKFVGGGLGELRVDYGPGYRVYFARRGTEIVLLLCGGDKDSQVSDIARAKALAKEWNDGA